jgi:hypothetical protein
MTRKDFVLIANALRYQRPGSKAEMAQPQNQNDACRSIYLQWEMTCTCMATELARTNPRFDRETFLTACGVM